jgi:hypothetical protein
LSTEENVGVELLELLAPPEALGEDDEEDELGEAALGEDEELLGEDELLEAPPEALPEDLLLSVALGLEELLLPEDLLLSVALGLEELLLPVLPVLCAAATPASAKSAADVAVTTTFNIMEIPPRGIEGRTATGVMQSPCPRKGVTRDFLHTRPRRTAHELSALPQRLEGSALGQREPVRDHSGRADEQAERRERLDRGDLLRPLLVVDAAKEGPQHGEGVDGRAEREQRAGRHDDRASGVGAAPQEHAGEQEHQPDDQSRDQDRVRDHARLLAQKSASEPDFVIRV